MMFFLSQRVGGGAEVAKGFGGWFGMFAVLFFLGLVDYDVFFIAEGWGRRGGRRGGMVWGMVLGCFFYRRVCRGFFLGFYTYFILMMFFYRRGGGGAEVAEGFGGWGGGFVFLGMAEGWGRRGGRRGFWGMVWEAVLFFLGFYTYDVFLSHWGGAEVAEGLGRRGGRRGILLNMRLDGYGNWFC
jgi:hypothetical protein